MTTESTEESVTYVDTNGSPRYCQPGGLSIFSLVLPLALLHIYLPLAMGMARLVVATGLLFHYYNLRVARSDDESYTRRSLTLRMNFISYAALSVIGALHYLQSISGSPMGDLQSVLLILPLAYFRFRTVNECAAMNLDRIPGTESSWKKPKFHLVGDISGSLVVALIEIYLPIYVEFGLLVSLVIAVSTQECVELVTGWDGRVVGRW